MSRGATLNHGMRLALIEAAARLIATEGPGALTLRRVAEEVRTSTMAVYTHFGGMPELRRAVLQEGVTRLAERLAQVDESDDPVADLAMFGLAYYANALSNPYLYRAMFMDVSGDDSGAGAHGETRNFLTGAVERCMAAGRFAQADATQLANNFWAVGHGAVTWQHAGLFSPEEALNSAARGVLSLLIGWGDDPDAARRSLVEAGRRRGLSSDATAGDRLRGH